MYKHHSLRKWYWSIYFLFGHQIKHYHCYELWFAHCNHCNLIFSSLKLENGLKKYVRNVARMKYEFVELVVILFTFIQDVIMLFLLILPEKDSHCACMVKTQSFNFRCVNLFQVIIQFDTITLFFTTDRKIFLWKTLWKL